MRLFSKNNPNENEVAAPLCDSIAIVENTEVTLIFPVLFGLAGAE